MNIKSKLITLALGLSMASCITPMYTQAPPPYYPPPPSEPQPGTVYTPAPANDYQQNYNTQQQQNYNNQPQQNYSTPAPQSYQVFYDNLSQYGEWVRHPRYGNIWLPDAGPDFMPYSTSGHWVFTEYGWTWASDYPWGWAAFHYGRWDYDPLYGWFWIPDSEWGPAWVSWRRSEGYYGWTPMAPGISVSYACEGWNPPSERWVFCDEHYVGRSDMDRYYAPRNRNVTIIEHTTIINNTYIENNTHNVYMSGPRREEVEHVRGEQIKAVALHSSTQPGQSFSNNELTIYRPRVSKNAGIGAQAQPAHIKPIEESRHRNSQIDPVSQHPGNNPEQFRRQNSGKVEDPARIDAQSRVQGPHKDEMPDNSRRQMQGFTPDRSQQPQYDPNNVPQDRMQRNQGVQPGRAKQPQYNPNNIPQDREQQVNQPDRAKQLQYNPNNIPQDREQQVNQPDRVQQPQYNPNNMQQDRMQRNQGGQPDRVQQPQYNPNNLPQDRAQQVNQPDRVQQPQYSPNNVQQERQRPQVSQPDRVQTQNKPNVVQKDRPRQEQVNKPAPNVNGSNSGVTHPQNNSQNGSKPENEKKNNGSNSER